MMAYLWDLKKSVIFFIVMIIIDNKTVLSIFSIKEKYLKSTFFRVFFVA